MDITDFEELHASRAACAAREDDGSAEQNTDDSAETEEVDIWMYLFTAHTLLAACARHLEYYSIPDFRPSKSMCKVTARLGIEVADFVAELEEEGLAAEADEEEEDKFKLPKRKHA